MDRDKKQHCSVIVSSMMSEYHTNCLCMWSVYFVLASLAEIRIAMATNVSASPQNIQNYLELPWFTLVHCLIHLWSVEMVGGSGWRVQKPFPSCYNTPTPRLRMIGTRTFLRCLQSLLQLPLPTSCPKDQRHVLRRRLYFFANFRACPLVQLCSSARLNSLVGVTFSMPCRILCA